MAGFYNIQQAAAKLKMSEDDVRKLVRDGQLREFRDAKGPAYKAAEVDAMAGHMDDTEIGLMDTKAGSAAVPEKPAPQKPAAPEKPGSDTSVFSLDAAAADTDAQKTDVFSLEPAGESSDEKKSGSGSGSSISLLDDLENITIPADPMAETVVSSEGIEGTPGGSGLMDLARESDDTSLGAELYDEPAEAEAVPAADSTGTSAVAIPAESAPSAPAEYYVAPAAGYEVTDPMAPAFIGMSVVGLIALLVAGMAVAAGVMGAWPSLLDLLYANILWYLLGAVVAAGGAFGIGFMLNRQAETRRFARSRVAAEGADA